MMDTDAIYSAVCDYGTANYFCWHSDASDILSDIKRLLNVADEEHNALLATNENLVDDVGSLKAARIAYASEFPPIPDGDAAGLPAVDRIHENIRRLKAENAELKAALKKCRNKASRWALEARFAALVAAAEREECAKVAERATARKRTIHKVANNLPELPPCAIADAIRAMGKQ